MYVDVDFLLLLWVSNVFPRSPSASDELKIFAGAAAADHSAASMKTPQCLLRKCRMGMHGMSKKCIAKPKAPQSAQAKEPMLGKM